MSWIRTRDLLALLLSFMGVFVAGCGGGQDSAPAQSQSISPANPLSVLAWNPPSSYADNAALDPYRDLDHYEIYVSENGDFTDTDLPTAVVAAVKDASSTGGIPGGGVLEREFLLNNIESFIGAGNRHYVSLKAVGVDGQKSAFMSPVVWDKI